MKLDKVLMSCDESHYQYFWPVVSKICKKILGVTPVLFKVGDYDSDFYPDCDGIVKVVKRVEDVPTSVQGQLLRLYGTKYFPDEVCLISDIDMMLISKKYFIDDLKKYSDDSYLILSSDAYDLKRGDCEGLFNFEVYPMCYHASKGKIFGEIIETEDTFEKFLKKVLEHTSKIEHKWYSDEIYLSSMINNKINDYEIHKLKRGYQEKFLVVDRIEKYNFPVDYIANEGMKRDNEILGSYDIEKLKNDYYIDCHCVRPYGFYKKEIWDVAHTIMESKNIIEKDLILVTSYCDTKEKLNVLRNLVNQISNHRDKFDLMVISHTLIPEDISEKTTLSIYDSKNELLYDFDLRSTPWFDPNNERPIHSIFTGFFNTHLAIWRMIIMGNSIAKNLGYKKVHHLEYDSDIKDFSEFYENSKILDYKDAVFYNKIVSTVDPIVFGTFQSYRVDKLHPEFLNLNEDKIKTDIKNSFYKSPEKMLFDLLNHSENVHVKNKNVLDTNENTFGMSHNKISNGNTAWCLPYYDMTNGKLGFVIWNMEEIKK